MDAFLTGLFVFAATIFTYWLGFVRGSLYVKSQYEERVNRIERMANGMLLPSPASTDQGQAPRDLSPNPSQDC
jgi:hypothetical protein